MFELDKHVAAVLGIPITQVTDELGPATFGDWTSLRHVQLIAAVQRESGTRLTPREVRSVRSVGDLRRILGQYGVLA